MLFTLNHKSAKPVYAQIIARVKTDVARGALAPGDKLPTIRELAAQLRVNRNTVARAYQELERSGIIHTRPGGGSFIAEGDNELRLRERMRILEELAHELAVQAFHFQIDGDKLLKVVRKQLDILERGKNK